MNKVKTFDELEHELEHDGNDKYYTLAEVEELEAEQYNKEFEGVE